MKKVLLRAYLNYNLGDDIFVKLLLERYKNNFYIYSKNKYDSFYNYNNIIYCGTKLSILFDKLMKKFFNIHDFKETREKKQYDLMAYIGGSLFIENEIQDLNFWIKNFNQYKKNIIPYYILGTNFGPYKTEKFKIVFNDNLLKSIRDICFRDNYSYNLFSKSKNVRYAPDILFSLNVPQINNNLNSVVISLINCNKKLNENYTNQYEEKMIELIEFFQKKQYGITLMSFCKNEGDEETVNSIYYKLNDSKIQKYFYSGNINEALNVLNNSKIIVGSRFHANILGMIMNKTVIPVAYSDKTLNVLKDINFKGKVFDIRHLDEFDVNSLTDKDLAYKINVDKYRKDAEKHFEKLDQVLERR